jgi:hypothetical protein
VDSHARKALSLSLCLYLCLSVSVSVSVSASLFPYSWTSLFSVENPCSFRLACISSPATRAEGGVVMHVPLEVTSTAATLREFPQFAADTVPALVAALAAAHPPVCPIMLPSCVFVCTYVLMFVCLFVMFAGLHRMPNVSLSLISPFLPLSCSLM